MKDSLFMLEPVNYIIIWINLMILIAYLTRWKGKDEEEKFNINYKYLKKL